MFFKERAFSKDPLRSWALLHARVLAGDHVKPRPMAYVFIIVEASDLHPIHLQRRSLQSLPQWRVQEFCEFSERHFALLTDLS